MAHTKVKFHIHHDVNKASIFSLLGLILSTYSFFVAVVDVDLSFSSFLTSDIKTNFL